MPDTSVLWLRVAAALYFAGLLHAVLTAIARSLAAARQPVTATAAARTFALGAVLHGVSVIERGLFTGRLPANDFFETTSLCGFLIAAAFLFISWRYSFADLGLVAYPSVFFLTLVAAMASPIPTWTNPRVRSALLLLHVALVLIGYAALLLTAGASMFYLMQERRLKRKETEGLDRLPPLATLDNLINRAMAIGFACITLGLVVGTIWAFIDAGTRWIGDPKIAISFLTWGAYLAMVFLRTSAGWRGRRAALLSLGVLGFSAITWAAHVRLLPQLAP